MVVLPLPSKYPRIGAIRVTWGETGNQVEFPSREKSSDCPASNQKDRLLIQRRIPGQISVISIGSYFSISVSGQLPITAIGSCSTPVRVGSFQSPTYDTVSVDQSPA